MKDQKRLSLKDPSILYLSFFGTGFIPFAPGTMGSLAALPILYLLAFIKDHIYFYGIFFLCLVIITYITCLIADRAQKRHSVHDPSWIVIDEVLGILVTWSFAPSNDFFDLLIVFILFRFFDIVKIWPASTVDRRVHHGMGTILDDIISGVYAGIVYAVCRKFVIF